MASKQIRENFIEFYWLSIAILWAPLNVVTNMFDISRNFLASCVTANFSTKTLYQEVI
jgi:hypothetical protein